MNLTPTDDRGPRIAAVDALRGLAIACMVVYHFAWDLSSFGFYGVNVIEDPGWSAFARTIAGTFVGLVGVSLVLATRKGLRWRPYLRRLAIIIGAAVLVTIGTWYWFPDAYVFFGILHLIAFASVAALPFLFLPTAIVLLAAIVIFAAPFLFTSEAFNHPLLWWIGFTPNPPITVDYVPVFPWLAVTLFGIVAGRLLVHYGSDTPLARWGPAGWPGRLATTAGRWSLPIYLVHQPILIGLLTLAAPFAPPDPRAEAATFTNECITSCRTTGTERPVCEVYCNCVLEGMQEADLLSTALAGRMSPEENNRWLSLVNQCRPNDDEPEAAAEPSPAN